jgi:hypothetical protein
LTVLAECRETFASRPENENTSSSNQNWPYLSAYGKRPLFSRIGTQKIERITETEPIAFLVFCSKAEHLVEVWHLV